MRTLNFWVNFNLKNKEGKNLTKSETISGFVNNKDNQNVFYYSEIKKEFETWIKEINDRRRSITHKVVEKRMQGSFSVTANWDNLDNVNLTKNITIGILDIKDLETYCQDKLDKLKNLIQEYFKDY